MMKYLPTDVSSFSTMMTGNYLYIDKTRHIYNLFSAGKRLYFLSRPRRFGKSLLISTLKELFLGNRALFKGLWIDSSDYEWAQYPVIHIDFAEIKGNSIDDLEANLLWRLQSIAQDYSISIESAPTLYTKLSLLVSQLARTNKVVILVDEYDKPILDAITDLEKAENIKKVIASFYEVIKSLDVHIRALFITGVTKFAKTSIFSGMNNLRDISLNEHSAQLLGYTQEEIVNCFSDYIQAIALKKNSSVGDILEKMRLWYNGYRFSESEITVYNPFSVLYYLEQQKFANYWFKSGTPTFLIHLIKQQYIKLEEVPTEKVSLRHVESFELNNIPLIPLLFQAGYLTIADYDTNTDRMTLDYPNYEIKDSFVEYIVASLSYTSALDVNSAAHQLIKTLDTYDIDRFCVVLTSLFANIPYSLRINKESYYHSLFHFLMNLLMLETRSEQLTNKGRIDTVIIRDDYIYVFELKVNKKPEEALEQIINTKYYEAYIIYNKPIILVGLSFIINKQGFSVTYVLKKM